MAPEDFHRCTTTHAAWPRRSVAASSSEPNPYVADPSGEIDIYDLAQILATSEGPVYHRTPKVLHTAAHRSANTYWAVVVCRPKQKSWSGGLT